MVSAGPNHLGSFKKYINSATKIELGIHISNGNKFKEKVPISIVNTKSLLLKINLKILNTNGAVRNGKTNI